MTMSNTSGHIYNQQSSNYNLQKDMDLYRDDGILLLNNRNGKPTEIIRKEITKI